MERGGTTDYTDPASPKSYDRRRWARIGKLATKSTSAFTEGLRRDRKGTEGEAPRGAGGDGKENGGRWSDGMME